MRGREGGRERKGTGWMGEGGSVVDGKGRVGGTRRVGEAVVGKTSVVLRLECSLDCIYKWVTNKIFLKNKFY